jgi:uncharacterized protein YbjT (DUF2867 family)
VTEATSRHGCVVRPAGMTNTMTVLVTGASGNLGSAVLPRLIKDGHDVRPMSRRGRPGWVAADLATGEGLREAVRGVDAIVHLASSPTKTRATDVDGTRRLVAEARAAGVRHVLYVSIIGIERVPLPYYRLKVAAEAVVRDGGVPFTLLRAAQFPTLIDSLLKVSSRLGPVLIDKRMRFQPVAVEDVADRIADLLADGPSGGVVEVAGPRSETLEVLAREWLAARGSRRPVWPIRVPGRFGREVRAGALTTQAQPTGTRTWRDYLEATY